MSLLHKLREFFGGRALRNKPGGLAMIVGERGDELNGRIVRTMRNYDGDMWEIEPSQRYVTTRAVRFMRQREDVPQGSLVEIIGISDDQLQPLRDPPHDARDESLAYLPPVPKQDTTSPTLPISEPLRLPVRQMVLKTDVGCGLHHAEPQQSSRHEKTR